MAYTFQHLSPSALPQARALLAVFGEAFGEPETYVGRQPDAAYLAGLLAKPHVLVVVALDGATVVGGQVAYEHQKQEQARSEIYIYDKAV